MSARVIETPAGRLLIEENGGALTRIARVSETTACGGEPGALLDEAQRQIAAYFGGGLRSFDLPLDMSAGTAFEREVWRALCGIPYGEIRTYGELAKALGRPKASRAVGGACSRNPLLIVVPCHRVIAGTGGLTGFAAGLDAKETLLRREGWTIKNGCVRRK